MAAIGLSLVVVGWVMLTLAAPAQQVGGTSDEASVVTTAPGVLASTGRRVQVSADGEGAFLGLARAEEARAWLAGVQTLTVDGLQDETTLALGESAGAAPEAVDPPADPVLADIWQEQADGPDASLTLDDPQPGDVVVALAPQGTSLELTWQRPSRHPGAWPAVVGGALLTVAGLAWLVALNARAARLRRASR